MDEKHIEFLIFAYLVENGHFDASSKFLERRDYAEELKSLPPVKREALSIYLKQRLQGVSLDIDQIGQEIDRAMHRLRTDESQSFVLDMINPETLQKHIESISKLQKLSVSENSELSTDLRKIAKTIILCSIIELKRSGGHDSQILEICQKFDEYLDHETKMSIQSIASASKKEEEDVKQNAKTRDHIYKEERPQEIPLTSFEKYEKRREANKKCYLRYDSDISPTVLCQTVTDHSGTGDSKVTCITSSFDNQYVIAGFDDAKVMIFQYEGIFHPDFPYPGPKEREDGPDSEQKEDTDHQYTKKCLYDYFAKINCRHEEIKMLKAEEEKLKKEIHDIKTNFKNVRKIKGQLMNSSGFQETGIFDDEIKTEKLKANHVIQRRLRKELDQLYRSKKMFEGVQAEYLTPYMTKIESKTLLGHSGPVFCVSITDDNIYCISAGYDRDIRLWTVRGGIAVAKYKAHQSCVLDLSFAHYMDSTLGVYFLSCSTDTTAKMWSTETTGSLRAFLGHTKDVQKVRFHPNLNYAITGSEDCTIRVWSILTAECVRQIRHTPCNLKISHILFRNKDSQIRSLIVTSCGGDSALESEQNSEVFPNSYVIVGTETGKVVVYNIERDTPVTKFFVSDEENSAVWDLAMSHDNKILCVIREDDTPLLYDFQEIVKEGSFRKMKTKDALENPFLLTIVPRKTQKYLSCRFTDRNLLVCNSTL
ncbi:unnamed protein product [Moneuplotes crassus]|uniref:Uncharacterized protein n=1 Tax=Euplotes crassus TaxID=5936 RepID=A0AAD1Y718_EUPCR|nr:unnamed protein product [Moneuplotes crassus]